jgi:hypothetical protein
MVETNIAVFNRLASCRELTYESKQTGKMRTNNRLTINTCNIP